MAQVASKHEPKRPSCAQKPTKPALYFCPLEAEALGLNEAIVVARLRFWLGRSKHVFGGKPWVYNTYPDWQKQFPFWSTFTVKSIFRRLERLGVLESTQRFNTNRWNRTKWYTLNEDALAERLGSGVVPKPAEPETAADQAVAMGAAATMEGEQAAAIEGVEAVAIDGGDFVPCLAGRSPERNTKSAGASETEGEAHTPALGTARPVVTSCHHGEDDDLDAACAAIPEAEREAWYERADRTLEAAGMPEWVRIAPTVKEMALRLWVGATIPGLATG